MHTDSQVNTNHLQSQALQFFKTSGTTHQVTRLQIPENFESSATLL